MSDDACLVPSAKNHPGRTRTCTLRIRSPASIQLDRGANKATGRHRTDNLRFTGPLLCPLSYRGAWLILKRKNRRRGSNPDLPPHAGGRSTLIELRRHHSDHTAAAAKATPTGFEPAPSSSTVRRSTIELRRQSGHAALSRRPRLVTCGRLWHGLRRKAVGGNRTHGRRLPRGCSANRAPTAQSSINPGGIEPPSAGYQPAALPLSYRSSWPHEPPAPDCAGGVSPLMH